MEKRVIAIACAVIERADREHPADATLRAELRDQRGLSREQGRKVSEAVFAYYRWRGWLDSGEPLSHALPQAIALAQEFAEHPSRFATVDLRARGVPAWINAVMDTPDEWLLNLQQEPTLWLRSRPGRAGNLIRRLGDARGHAVTTLDDAVAYFGKEDLFATPEFHDGEFELQDIASQGVGWICAPGRGETWWDACAGEGGKTLHLSDLMQNTGLIWSTDRAVWRLQRLKRRAARARVFNYRIAPWDGSPDLPTRTRFDGVLVDAPCSGTGTWHRNPHARWTSAAEDVAELARIQLQLLTRAAAAVKPGGRLVYSVCTLTRPETTEVAQSFGTQFPEFQPTPGINPFSPTTAPAARQHWWPQATGGGGMFVASWTKVR